MSARVLVIGLDGAEPRLLERWAGSGRLPHLAGLLRETATLPLDDPHDTLPGSIWPEIQSGLSVGRHGHFFTQDQLRTGEARWRPVTEEEAEPARLYWSVASRAGRRVAVVDPPHAPRQPELDGIQLLELASHDRSRGFGRRLDPPEVLEPLGLGLDDFPVWDSDAYASTPAGYRRLLDELTLEAGHLARVHAALLAREPWDLYSATFGALHSVGHRVWPVLDPDHPLHASSPPALHERFARLLDALDEAVGALLAGAGPEARVVLVAASGMGPLIGGPNLLPEVLARLGMSSGGGSWLAEALRGLQERVKARTPLPRVQWLQRVSQRPWVRRLQEPMGGMVFPLLSPRTRACAIPNNRIGAIRLNVRGREPCGCIEPGAGVEAVVEELTRELLALTHLETGEPIVAEVVPSEEAFGPDRHPDLPDLLVRFRRDRGQLDGCRSPRVGVVRARADHARSPRAGDHTGHSRLWLRAPEVAPGAELPRGHVVDVAPTVLSLLGVAPPDGLDGASVLSA